MMTKAGSASGRRRRRRLAIEELERRIAPAGNVTAVVTGGNLVITGDAAFNDIVIDQVGLGADQLRVNTGPGWTLINNAAGPQVFGGITKSLKTNMGDGSDRLTLQDSVVALHALLDLGEGDNVLNITDTDIMGKLVVKGGGQNETVTFVDLDLALVAKGKLTLGDGDNTLDWNTTVPGIPIVRDLSVSCGTGNDTITLTNFTATGNAKLLLGEGDNSLDMARFAIGGNLQITCAGGLDTVMLEDFTVFGATKMKLGYCPDVVITDISLLPTNNTFNSLAINSGGGDDNVQIRDTNALGNVSLNLGAMGFDMLGVHGFTNTCEFGGKFTATTGENANSVELDNVYVTGKTAIKTGDGNDLVELDGLFNSSVMINAGAGANTVKILDNVLVLGAFKVNTGVDDDYVQIDDSVFLGNASISTGAGNDTVGIEKIDATATQTTFISSFTVKAGAGDDSIRIGIDGSAIDSANFNSKCILSGGAGLLDDLDMGIIALTLNGNTFAVGYTTPGIEVIST